MPAGLQIFNDTGVLQIDETYRNLQLVEKASVSVSALQLNDMGKDACVYASITRTGLSKPLLAYAAPSGVLCGVIQRRTAGGASFFWDFYAKSGSAVTVDFWLFDEVASPPETVGLAVYTSTGALAYASSLGPLRIVGLSNLNSSEQVTASMASGRTYAAVQTMSGVEKYVTGSPGSYNVQDRMAMSKWVSNAFTARRSYSSPDTDIRTEITDAEYFDFTSPGGQFLLVDVTHILVASPPPPPPPPPPVFSLAKSGDVTGTRSSTGVTTTASVTITPSNATGAVTYSWARVSGDATFTAGSPTSATTNFSATVTAPGTKSSVWRCTGVDSVGNVATIDVALTATATVFAISKSGNATGTRSGSGSVNTNSVTVTPTGHVGGVTYSWARLSGDTDFSATAGTSNVTAFSATYTAPDSATATWRCTATDSLGSVATVDVTVFSEATVPAFSPVTHTYTSGTGATETVPAGATNVRIRVRGGGGSGGYRTNSAIIAGGGGGGGGFSERTIGVTGGNTFTYTVGATVAGRVTQGNGTAGNASSCSGTPSGGSVSMTGNGGGAGGGTIAALGGAGGTASGGTTNTSGGAGDDGITGVNGLGGSPNGGSGGSDGLPSDSGFNGSLEFYYT